MNDSLNNSNEALKAAHRIVVLIRNSGYLGTEPKQLADMLDNAEYLLSLIIQGGSQFASEFLPSLELMCQQYPDWAYIAAEYKKGLSSESQPRQLVEIAA